MTCWVVDQLCAVERAACEMTEAEGAAAQAAPAADEALDLARPRPDRALDAARHGDFGALREIVSELAGEAFGPEYGARFAASVVIRPVGCE
jgi:hypothetical protein